MCPDRFGGDRRHRRRRRGLEERPAIHGNFHVVRILTNAATMGSGGSDEFGTPKLGALMIICVSKAINDGVVITFCVSCTALSPLTLPLDIKSHPECL